MTDAGESFAIVPKLGWESGIIGKLVSNVVGASANMPVSCMASLANSVVGSTDGESV